MASQLYPKGKKKLLDADIDMLVDTIKIVPIDRTTDEPNITTTDEFLSDIVTYSGATAATLGTKNTDSGVFDAQDLAPAYSSLSQSGSKTIGALVIYKDTGVAATSPLIAWIEVTPVAPNGGNINITFDSGASKIFAI